MGRLAVFIKIQHNIIAAEKIYKISKKYKKSLDIYID